MSYSVAIVHAVWHSADSVDVDHYAHSLTDVARSDVGIKLKPRKIFVNLAGE
jgi:hypothetical protein